MNFFQILADLMHITSFIILIKQIFKYKSVQEVSYRTQEIYLIVFIFRYIDKLNFHYLFFYNFLMRIIFIGWTIYTIYLIQYKKPYCFAYDKDWDNFDHRRILYPVVMVVTILFHLPFHNYDNKFFFKLLKSISYWLESVAILPQLNIIIIKKEVEIITWGFMISLGLYRLFYIFSWFDDYYNGHPLIWIKIISALIQTGIYFSFLYYYSKSIKLNKLKYNLPF